jgi:hypothetical protein
MHEALAVLHLCCGVRKVVRPLADVLALRCLPAYFRGVGVMRTRVVLHGVRRAIEFQIDGDIRVCVRIALLTPGVRLDVGSFRAEAEHVARSLHASALEDVHLACLVLRAPPGIAHHPERRYPKGITLAGGEARLHAPQVLLRELARGRRGVGHALLDEDFLALGEVYGDVWRCVGAGPKLITALKDDVASVACASVPLRFGPHGLWCAAFRHFVRRGGFAMWISGPPTLFDLGE